MADVGAVTILGTQDMTIFRRGSEEGCLQLQPQEIKCVQSEMANAMQGNEEL